MFDSIRKFALTIAATLIGVGNVACACPDSTGSSSETAHAACDTPPPEVGVHDSRADMQAGMHHAPAPALNAGTDRENTPPDHAQCGHCNLAAFAQSATADDGVVSPIAKILKTTAATIGTVLPDFARREVANFDRGRWRAPPTETPVSLKIRFRT